MTSATGSPSKAAFPWWLVGFVLVFVILPLVLGLWFARQIKQPVVGVIKLDAAIEAYSASDMLTQITYAREHNEIRAVVLVLDSPGGTVADTEAVYLELLRLRAQKPVVTVINTMSASGAYYLSVGTDYIFAKPTSEVGNIGVIGSMPSTPSIDETTISTGPYKLWGSPRDSYARSIEMVKQGFFQAVKLGRGDALKLTDDEVVSGKLWLGTEALRNGIIDELGTQTQAQEKAAQLARISNYAVSDLRKLSGLPEQVTTTFYFMAPDGTSTGLPAEPGLYLLYVPMPEVVK